MRDIPNLYACVCGPRAGYLPYLVQTAGAHKVIFGSDFGFSDWTILAEFLDNVREANIDRESMDHILYKNAARLLHLDERPLPASQLN